MPTNSQLLTTESKKQAKQTTRTGTESQIWRSFGGEEESEEEHGGKGTGNKKHKWQAQNRQGEVKNSIGNGEARELICPTHGHELGGEDCWRKERYEAEGGKGGKLGQQ